MRPSWEMQVDLDNIKKIWVAMDTLITNEFSVKPNKSSKNFGQTLFILLKKKEPER